MIELDIPFIIEASIITLAWIAISGMIFFRIFRDTKWIRKIAFAVLFVGSLFVIDFLVKYTINNMYIQPERGIEDKALQAELMAFKQEWDFASYKQEAIQRLKEIKQNNK